MSCILCIDYIIYRSFISIVSFSLILTSFSIGIHYFSKVANLHDSDYCSKTYSNNIGHRSFSDKFCYPIIDAVYTWVNGSDPTWIKEMLYYKNLEVNSANLTDYELESLTSSLSKSRFRDNGELKYFSFCHYILDIRSVQSKSLLLGSIRCLS